MKSIMEVKCNHVSPVLQHTLFVNPTISCRFVIVCLMSLYYLNNIIIIYCLSSEQLIQIPPESSVPTQAVGGPVFLHISSICMSVLSYQTQYL